jgi:hypothetical protein
MAPQFTPSIAVSKLPGSSGPRAEIIEKIIFIPSAAWEAELCYLLRLASDELEVQG